MAEREFAAVSKAVIGCAIDVHKELGPGLLESAYQRCLAHELELRGIPFAAEHPLDVDYKGLKVDCAYRADLFVDESLIVELKSVAEFSPVHKAQILTYMRLAKVRHGLLINFNVKRLKDGLKSFIL